MAGRGDQSLSEGDSHQAGDRTADRKEVTVIGDEVAVGRLIRVWSNHRGLRPGGVVRVERVPHQWAAVDARVEAKICQASRLLATSDKVT